MRYVYLTLFLIVVLGASVFGFRGSLSTRSPLEVFPDMDHQAKYKPQAESKFFADGRVDRPRPVGTVAFGRTESADANFLKQDVALFEGKDEKGQLFSGFPSALTVDARFLERGQDRFTVYCAPCHGALGDGNGITKKYGMGTTPSFHDDRLRGVPNGHIFNIITHGTPNKNMLSYADKLPADDRWAVIAYVRALQRAAHTTAADVPPGHKSELGIK